MLQPQPASLSIHPAQPCPLAPVASAIGNTPALYLRVRYDGEPLEILAKMEMYNLSGSIKDRMALSILREAYRSGALAPGQPIAEATSGNAGIAMAALGSALGHPVTIFMPDWMSVERRRLIESYGATVRPVSREEDGFLGAIAMAEECGETKGWFLPRQFCNQANCAVHCDNTIAELAAQADGFGGAALSGFVAGVGTGGTVMGAAQYFAQAAMVVPVHPMEPASSPTLSTGHKVGQHRMQGISDEFVPDIVKLEDLASIVQVDDGDAILMAQRIARELGIGVGISSGGNILAAVKVGMAQRAADPDAMPLIGTILCDNAMKYLSTALFETEPVEPRYLAPQIELSTATVIAAR